MHDQTYAAGRKYRRMCELNNVVRNISTLCFLFPELR